MLERMEAQRKPRAKNNAGVRAAVGSVNTVLPCPTAAAAPAALLWKNA